MQDKELLFYDNFDNEQGLNQWQIITLNRNSKIFDLEILLISSFQTNTKLSFTKK